LPPSPALAPPPAGRPSRWVAAALLLVGCAPAYVLRSAVGQAGLLASRTPVAEVRQDPALTPDQARALDLVADVKAWGAARGFSATDNYETVAWGWDRQIHVVLACDPLAFEARTTWFPIVGEVAYLGFFDPAPALRRARRWEAQGWEVNRRTAGAFSSLGFFRDPILPDMLGWSTLDLADTVLHELAHATVWVPGSVGFNESFASFVGETGAFQYLEDRHGADSELLRAARAEAADGARWRGVLQGLHADLDALFRDPARSDAEKAREKARLYASLPARVEAAGFAEPARYRAAAARGLNNAALYEFATYNDPRTPVFQALFEREGRDLLAFMRAVQDLTRGQRRDPFGALQAAVAGPGAVQDP